MKNKISRILGVGLTIALITSLMVSSLPASAGTESLGAEKNPVTQVDNTVLGLSYNIVDVAANGNTIYVATDNTTIPLMKSTDGGATWSNLKSKIGSTFSANVTAIAMASDSADAIAIATGDYKVYMSTDGGATFTNLSFAASTNFVIEDLDISAGTTRYVAVIGENGTADMYTLKAEMAQSWTSRMASGTGANTTQTIGKVVEYSPNYATDNIILTITGDAAGNSLLQAFRYTTGAYKWNSQISYFNADWRDGVILETGLTGNLAEADIAVPASYLGTSETDRLVFTATAGTSGGGGVSRVADMYRVAFATWSGGDEGPVGSLAYNESGKLIAGDYDQAKVYQFLDPMATSPKAARQSTYKQPMGYNKVIVRWAGATVVAGTSGYAAGGGAAFSTSVDDGYSWNGMSLISTTLDIYSDYAVNADGSKIYLATSNGTDTTVWLKESGVWKTVFNLAGVTGANTIVRVAPTDDKTVYVADKNSQNIWVSKDSGKTSWKNIPVYALTGNVVDLAVQDANTAYVIDTGGVCKTTNAGASWGTRKTPTDAVVMATITLAPNNDILVGGSDGYAAFSKDGGSTFSRTKTWGTGTLYLVADKAYATNGYVYGGIGTSLKRGKADTTTDPSTRGTASNTIYGVAQPTGQEVTYYVSANTSESRVYRSLRMDVATSEADAEWSYLTTSANLTARPRVLATSISATIPKVWAVNFAASPGLYSMEDPIALTAVTVTDPADAASIKMNPGSGQSYDVTYTFKRYVTVTNVITGMQLQIATDSGFNAVLYDSGTFTVSTDTVAKIIGPTGNLAVYMPGQTYYWRVRMTVPMLSPWSTTRSFKVEQSRDFVISGPAIGAMDVSINPSLTWTKYEGAIRYEVALAEDPTFAIVNWSYNVNDNFYHVPDALKYNTTYYWRVRGVTAEPYVVGSAWVTPAGPYVTSVFTTEAAPAAPAPPAVITVPSAPEIKVVEIPAPSPVIPTYVLWVIVGIGAILVIALIVLIVRTRRVV